MTPRVVRDIDEARQWVRGAQQAGERVGIVPTMGALHAGHMSLVKTARQRCQRVVTTIFVNPTQFGAGEDLDRYPRTWEQDLELLAAEQVDVVFAPAVDAMYPSDMVDPTIVTPSKVSKRWEGEYRPTHFGGVATVVMKLFQILPADIAFFGEKDFQQCRVIADMVRDLNVGIELEFVPIKRDADGLALSSRNAYLSEIERQRALQLSAGLRQAQQAVRAGERNAETIVELVRSALESAPVDSIDYVAVCDVETLEPVHELTGNEVVLIAANVGVTRLIDNARLRL